MFSSVPLVSASPRISLMEEIRQHRPCTSGRLSSCLANHTAKNLVDFFTFILRSFYRDFRFFFERSSSRLKRHHHLVSRSFPCFHFFATLHSRSVFPSPVFRLFCISLPANFHFFFSVLFHLRQNSLNLVPAAVLAFSPPIHSMPRPCQFESCPSLSPPTSPSGVHSLPPSSFLYPPPKFFS